MKENYSGQSIWNFDEDRMRTLSYYMNNFEYFVIQGNVQETYNYLHSIFLVIQGTGEEKEEEELDKEFEKLEEFKRKCPLEQNYAGSVEAIYFLNQARKIYRLMNRYNTKSGLYFRKSANPRKAISM